MILIAFFQHLPFCLISYEKENYKAEILVFDEDNNINNHIRNRITNIVTDVQKHFNNYMKSVGKLGGQNKVPRLANDRKIADELTKFSVS